MPLQVDLIFQGYTSGQRNHQAHHDIHQDHVHQYTQLTQHSYAGKEQNVPLQIIRAHLVNHWDHTYEHIQLTIPQYITPPRLPAPC